MANKRFIEMLGQYGKLAMTADEVGHGRPPVRDGIPLTSCGERPQSDDMPILPPLDRCRYP